ncbi:MAG: FtsX-like permease family protein [Candidatus Atribacteria bacterium]|nr:FtsX-like permease family protein [Candidatus Atribacteria bacterium]
MNLFEKFQSAISNVLSNKLRSFLTMLGIIIGVAAVITMVSVGQGMRTNITSQIQSLGSNRLTVRPGFSRVPPGTGVMQRGGMNIFTYDHYLGLLNAQIGGIKAIGAQASTNKVITYEKEYTRTSIIGTTPNYPDLENFKPAMGRFFSQYDLDHMTRVVVLGQTVAEDLFGNVDSSIVGKKVKIGDVSFTVIGIMEKKMSMGMDRGDQVFIPLTTAQKRITGSKYLQTITVETNTIEDMDSVSDYLEAYFLRKFDNDPDKFDIMNSQDILDTVTNVTGSITLFLVIISGISLLVGGIGIMNIMLVSVTERTREIGLRKAIGAKTTDILSQFMIEASVLSLTGGLIGIILGILSSFIVSKVSSWSTTISWPSIIYALGISVAVGLFFGIYPARRASQLNPITALRFE